MVDGRDGTLRENEGRPHPASVQPLSVGVMDCAARPLSVQAAADGEHPKRSSPAHARGAGCRLRSVTCQRAPAPATSHIAPAVVGDHPCQKSWIASGEAQPNVNVMRTGMRMGGTLNLLLFPHHYHSPPSIDTFTINHLKHLHHPQQSRHSSPQASHHPSTPLAPISTAARPPTKNPARMR